MHQPKTPAQKGLLIFLHIPKTAGTSLSRIIRIKYGIWPPRNWLSHSLTFGHYQIPKLADRFNKISSLTPTQQQKIKLFQGHFGFGVHERLPENSFYVSMVRDPVERVISSYYQLGRGRDDNALAKNMTLEQFVECGQKFGRFFVDNGQVRAFTGLLGEPNDKPFNTLDRTDLEKAKQNIINHCALVGLSERFDESALLLKQILGWRHCYYVKANVGKNRKAKEEFSPKTIELIRQYNQLDYELYEFIAGRFEKLIEAQNQDFEQQLQRFQKANQRYTYWIGPLTALLPWAKRIGQKIGLVR